LEIWVPQEWNHFFGSVDVHDDKTMSWAQEELPDGESDGESPSATSAMDDAVDEDSDKSMLRTLMPTFPKWESLVHDAFVYLYGLADDCFIPPPRNIYFVMDALTQVAVFIFLYYC